MKILHITPSYKPAFIYGGTTVSVGKLCESLAESHDVTVITTTANGLTELPEANKEPIEIQGVKVYYFKRITKDHTHLSPELLYFLFKNARNYDIIQIHSWWNLVAVFAVLVCWIKGIKPILSPRGMLSSYSFENENSFKKKIIHHTIGKFLLKRTFIHATASSEFEEGQQIIKSWKGFVLPNILPLPTKIFEVMNTKDLNKINLLFLSRIDPKKGIEFVFEALAKLQNIDKLENSQVNKKYTYEFTIIGGSEPEYLDELKELSKKLGISQNIVWAGRIEGDKRFQYYASADIFMLVSQNENFANVVLESLSQGTPVFISNRVGLADYIEANQLGEVTALNSDEILQKLINFINNKEKRKQIRDYAPQKIQHDFDSKALAQAYIKAYKDCKK